MGKQIPKALVAASLFLSICIHVAARPGDLDPTFGSGSGFQSFGFLGYWGERVWDVEALENDNFVMAWTFDFEGGCFNTELDSPADYDAGCALAIQPDRKQLEAWLGGGFLDPTYLAVARYLPDGQPDLFFGSSGIAMHGFGLGHGFEPYSPYVHENGKVTIGGEYTFNFVTTYYIARLNGNGTLDQSFGQNGLLSYPNKSLPIGLQADEKTILFRAADQTRPLSISRLNSTGADDTSFSWIPVDQTTYLMGTVRSDGKIYLLALDGLRRYNENGTLDNTFGNGGIVTAIPKYRIAIDRSNRILALDFHGVSRFLENGTLDTSFGVGGRTTIWYPNNGFALLKDIDEQENGKLLVALDRHDLVWRMTVARLLGDDDPEPPDLATVSGRVVDANFRGQSNVPVTIQTTLGELRARTSSFGYFQIQDVPTRQWVAINAKAKRLEYATLNIYVAGDISYTQFFPVARKKAVVDT